MNIEDIIRERDIKEILHFTTNRSITGILTSGAVKSRKRLPEEKYLEVERYQGGEGLERLFAEIIVRWNGNISTRDPSTPKNQPTCNQAEVLYLGELSLNFLQRIYVQEPDHACAIESQFDSLYPGLQRVECLVKPELF